MAFSQEVFSKLQSQLTCGVCLERYKDPRTLLCHHSYCKDCISQLPVSGQRVVKCPLCLHPTQLGENGSSALPTSVHISDLLEIDTLLMKTPASRHLPAGHHQQQSEPLNLQPAVQKQIELVEETLVLFDTKEREMREEGKQLQKKIDETHQQLTSKLEESKKKLSQEATDALMKKLQKHSSQKANVEAVLAKLKSHREERPGPPSKNQLQAHMKQLCIADTHSSEQVKVSELQPTQELNVMFVADKNALLACVHIGDIITKPSFLSARFSVDIPSRIFTKRQATILIKAPTTLPVSSKLSCQLAHLQDDNPVVCPVTSVGEGQFKVMIRSSTVGLHQLRVLVDEVDIYGSPFSVHVAEWKRQKLEKFATLDCPYGIAVTDDGQHVVVTESEANCVTILDSGTGKVVRNFAGCDNELKNPKSVAVSTENHIFMATSDSKVEKFSFSSSCEGFYDQNSVKSVPKLDKSGPVSPASHPTGLTGLSALSPTSRPTNVTGLLALSPASHPTGLTGLSTLSSNSFATDLSGLSTLSPVSRSTGLTGPPTLSPASRPAGLSATISHVVSHPVSHHPNSLTDLEQAGVTAVGPISLAVSPVSGKVFCTNLDKSECCITVLNADLTYSHSISGKGLSNKMGSIAIDSKGMLYVYDCNRGVVLKLTPEGKRLATIGSIGKQDYQFNEPVSLCIDSNDIMYVADKEKCRLVVFTTEGEYLGTLQHQNAVVSQVSQSTGGFYTTCQFQSSLGGLSQPMRQTRHSFGGVAADKNGNVYVCDCGNREVLVSRP